MRKVTRIRCLSVALLLVCSLLASSHTAEATFSHSGNNYSEHTWAKVLLNLERQARNHHKGGSNGNGIAHLPEVPAALPVAVALILAAGASHLCRGRKIRV
jgi:hypothetical protein